MSSVPAAAAPPTASSGFDPDTVDWEGWRQAFPAVERQILLNAAGGCPLSVGAAAAGAAYFEEMAAEGDGPFADWLGRVDAARGLSAALIGADATDIAFLASASVAMNAATNLVPPTTPVVSLEDEFPSVTLPWINRGHPTTLVPLGPDRAAGNEAVIAAMDAATGKAGMAPGEATVPGVLALSHVQFRNGHRVDVEGLARAAEARGWLTIVDATQSLGAVPIDVGRAPISVLLASGYKWLCAGYGNAVVYVSPVLRRRLPAPVYGWRSASVPYALHADRLDPTETAVTWEMGHPPFAPVFAVKGALEHLGTVGVDAVWGRIRQLNRVLHAALDAAGLPAPLSGPDESGITVLPTDRGPALKAALGAEGIGVTTSVGALRLSPHAYTRVSEIERAVDRIAAAWRTA